MNTLIESVNINIHPDLTISGKAKRTLILMSDTGGGHRAAAEAIREALIYLYGDAVTVTIADAWRHHVAWPVNRLGATYGWIVTKAVWLWKFFWLLEKTPWLIDSCLQSFYPLVAPGLSRLFRAKRPDVIVSVHPLLTLLPLMVLQQARLDIPFVTVVTDMVYGYHTWYRPQTTLCLVSTEQARQQAIDLGLAAEKIEVVGQPVALKFSSRGEEKKCLRRKFGLDVERPLILLSGGGEGYGPIFKVARCIARRVSSAQLVIVTGHNQALRKRLEAVSWEIPTFILGFINNMHDLMVAADVFITKAGPASINEAFVTELPLIIFAYIPGQEESNVRYVVKHNAGVYISEAEQIADLLLDWLQPGNPMLPQMAKNAARLAHPEATLKVARRIFEQATYPSPVVSANV